MRLISLSELPRNNRGGRVLIPYAILTELVESHNAVMRMHGGAGIRTDVRESGIVVSADETRTGEAEREPDLGDSGDGSSTQTGTGYSVAIRGITAGEYPVDLAASAQTLYGMRLRCPRAVAVVLYHLDSAGLLLNSQALSASSYADVTFSSPWAVLARHQLKLVVTNVTPIPGANETVLAGLTIY